MWVVCCVTYMKRDLFCVSRTLADTLLSIFPHVSFQVLLFPFSFDFWGIRSWCDLEFKCCVTAKLYSLYCCVCEWVSLACIFCVWGIFVYIYMQLEAGVQGLDKGKKRLLVNDVWHCKNDVIVLWHICRKRGKWRTYFRGLNTYFYFRVPKLVRGLLFIGPFDKKVSCLNGDISGMWDFSSHTTTLLLLLGTTCTWGRLVSLYYPIQHVRCHSSTITSKNLLQYQQLKFLTLTFQLWYLWRCADWKHLFTSRYDVRRQTDR